MRNVQDEVYSDPFIIPVTLTFSRGQRTDCALRGLATIIPCSKFGDSGWLSIQENVHIEVFPDTLTSSVTLTFEKGQLKEYV